MQVTVTFIHYKTKFLSLHYNSLSPFHKHVSFLIFRILVTLFIFLAENVELPTDEEVLDFLDSLPEEGICLHNIFRPLFIAFLQSLRHNKIFFVRIHLR